VALLAAGCGVGPPQATALGSGELAFGAIVALSGAFGPYGPAYQAGMQVAVDKVNAAGGVVVGNKKLTLKMLFKDDRSDAQVAVTNATQMFRDDGIKFLFGPLASEAVTMLPVAAQNNVINVALPDLYESKYPLYFSALPTQKYQTGVIVAAIQKFYPNAKKVDFVIGNTAATQAYYPPLVAQLQAAGITIGNFLFPAGTTDISTVATKVVADKPDVIVAGGSPQEQQNVLNQLDAAGLPKSVPCVCKSAVIPNLGRPQMFPSAYSPVDPGNQSTPEIEAFKTALMKQMNVTTLSPFLIGVGLAYYFVVQLTAKAVQKANSTTDMNAIAKVMQEVSLTEFGAKFQWGANHTITVPLAVTSLTASGQATVVKLTPS
jgi:ABC-type branched-subunit amino acid transport system substrate-binding protein